MYSTSLVTEALPTSLVTEALPKPKWIINEALIFLKYSPLSIEPTYSKKISICWDTYETPLFIWWKTVVELILMTPTSSIFIFEMNF